MDIKLFDYTLPQDKIAQKPLEKRDHSKLLVLDKESGSIRHDHFYNLDDYLKKGDVLVLNKSKVTKCRFFGIKEGTGARIECFVLRKESRDKYNVLIKPSKRLKRGDRVDIGKENFEVLEKYDNGEALVYFSKPAEKLFEDFGEMPLPPYIKSRDFNSERYQTVYAEREGSAAAPTAGLHFTPGMIDRLKKKGIVFASLYLDIGLDTFRPVTSDNIEGHDIHKEYYEIRESEAVILEKARGSGRRIIAVGTTSTRVLETVMQKYGKIKQDSGFTGIYIFPPYRFRSIDAMITNFHLPRSTLLLMVSAFAGRDNILKAYSEAVDNDYRFYSFGDCMLIK